MGQIPIAGPSISQLEIDYVADAVATAWYSEANKYHERFEKAFADYCGRRYAVSLPSCTSALHLSLLALGIKGGDEVIVSDSTWIASAAPVNYVGATPVFADIDPFTWCMSPDAFEANITSRTKAAIVVNLYGGMPDWDRLEKIAADHGIFLIEDAAESIGSRWRNRRSGSFGLMSGFSFHGSKTLTTGEGGMLVLDDEQCLARVLKLRDHGRSPGDTMFYNDEIGWKYKMSSMQAALGLAQLERIDELVQAKRRIFSWYRQALEGWNHGKLNHDIPELYNSYWMTTLIIDPSLGISKERLICSLKMKGVDVRPFFYPLSAIPAYWDTIQGQIARARNSVAQEISARGINLPSALSLDQATVQKICCLLKETVQELKSLKPRMTAEQLEQ
jgi:perosamine synthetase